MKEPVELKEENYVKKVLWDIWDDLPFWVLANLVFILFCFPAIALLLADLRAPSLLSAVVPFPAFAAITYCAGRVAKGESAGLRDLLVGMRRFMVRSLILGAVTISLAFINVSTYQIVQANPESLWLMVSWTFQISAFISLLTLHVYTFAVMTLYNTDIKTTFLSSLVLVLRNKMATLGMVGMIVLMAFLARLTWISLLLIFPAALAVFMANLTLLFVKKQQEFETSQSKNRSPKSQ
jgi:hypothetical protein